jgi:hypothetical protein
MSFNSTTLSSAMLVNDTTISVASATGITAPNFTTGVGLTYLLLETEYMLVTGSTAVSTVFTVQRGVAGSTAAAHAASTPVLAGAPSDFGVIVPSVRAVQDPSPAGQLYGFSAAVASAATIAAPSNIFHVTGGTAINIITPPTGMVEGQVTIVFDSTCTWTSSNVTNGISASGTSTVAGRAVTFYLDAGTSRWYPSVLA